MGDVGRHDILRINPELRRVPDRSHRAYLFSEPESIFELTPDTLRLLGAFGAPRSVGEVLPDPSEKESDVLRLLVEMRLLLREEGPTRRPVRWRPPLLRLFDAPAWEAAAGESSWAVLGACFDRNTLPMFPQGSADGPDAVRAATRLLPAVVDFVSGRGIGYWDPEEERQVLAGLRLTDAGNVSVQLTSASWRDFAAELGRVLAVLRRSGVRVLLLGGDHSVSLPAVAALAPRRIGVVHIDAHTDLAPIADPDDLNHGNVMRHIAALPHVAQVVQIGCRGFQVERPQLAGIDYRSYSTRRARSMAPRELASLLQRDLPYYLSIDIDALDPSAAPGTAAPVPDGFSLGEARTLIRHLITGRELVGVDLVEVLPSADRPAITCQAAAQLILEVLATQERA